MKGKLNILCLMIGLYVDWYFYGYSCAGYTSLWFKSGPSIFAGICIKEVNFLVIFWTVRPLEFIWGLGYISDALLIVGIKGGIIRHVISVLTI